MNGFNMLSALLSDLISIIPVGTPSEDLNGEVRLILP